jgi:hypothetical protein
VYDPLGLLGALRVLPELAEKMDAIREEVRRVADATAPLGQVANTTEVLPPMYERMSEIQQAMPVLVTVQEHLADLPEVMTGLAQNLERLTTLMEGMMTSIDQLDENVSSLRAAVEPLGRVADRIPSRRTRGA